MPSGFEKKAQRSYLSSVVVGGGGGGGGGGGAGPGHPKIELHSSILLQ